MSASWMRVLGLMIVSSWLVAGCSGAKIDVGGSCALNSDCNRGLVCTWGKCHDACHTTADCPAGQSCITASDQSAVCQLPVETHCVYASDCQPPLMCAVDQRCRNQCQTDVDCPTGQTCTTTKTCAEPNQVDSNKNLFAPDGGFNASGGASGADAAAGCPTGAETCSCYPNDTCNAGLTCASHLCVSLGASGTDGGAGGVAGTGVSGDAGVPDAPDGQPDVPIGGTGGGAGGIGDAGMPDAPGAQPDVPMGGSGGSAGSTISSTGGTTSSTGGTIISLGGTTSSGGAAVLGGSPSSGGVTSTGGTTTSGGTTAMGGSGGIGTGGLGGSGGNTGTGGTSGSAGAGGTMTGDDGGLGADTSSFHCVNWADPGDNFQAGVLQPTGLSSSDSYATVSAKANAILSGFQTVLKANSIRIPINEPTTTNTAWWAAYQGIIDTAISMNMKVIIGYWFKPGVVGTVQDMTAFYAMWQAVVDAYGTNDLVYFDIINEPSGYSASAFINLAVQWIAQYPSVPKNHVVVAGTGNDTDVNQQGADSRLAGCLLSLQLYYFSSPALTEQGWRDYVTTHVGPYYGRTIATEYGARMGTGLNYAGPIGTTVDIAFMTGVSNQFRDYKMGSCLWVGLRSGDSMSMTTLNGTGTNLTLTVTNASGLARLQSGWGL